MSVTLPPVHESLVKLLQGLEPEGELGRGLFSTERASAHGLDLNQLEARMPGLESIEREILLVHRHELCHLLQLAANEAVELETREPWLLSPNIDLRREHMRLDRGTFVQAVRAASNVQTSWRKVQEEHEPVGPATELLRGCLPLSDEGWPDSVDLFSAALRLVPRRGARIGLGLALGLHGRHDDALEVLEEASAGYPNVFEHSLVLQNQGAVLRWAGRLRTSLEVCRRASRLPVERPQILINWLDRCLLLDEREEALEAASQLDDMLTAEHPCLLQNEAALRQRTMAEGLPDSVIAPDEARRLCDEMGEPSRRISRAVLLLESDD